MTQHLSEEDDIAKTWEERPDIIRAFIEVRPQYEQLCSEVAYILKKRMDDSVIEYSAITNRAKTLKSFAEKLSRKQYDNPFNDVTDLAGVRVVYLYKSDRPKIESVIEDEFEIVEKVDKVEEQEDDRFGYGALHYLVHLGRKSSGARYDDLKGMICEVQVRTVLQDAWAIIDHHLVYKQESDVPKVLKRKLNSLSGLFETADDQFDRIRDEREVYKESVKRKLSNKDTFLDQDVNLDTFIEFLKWKFPEKPLAKDDLQLSRILAAATGFGFSTLADLDKLLRRTERARAAISAQIPGASAAGEIGRAIALVKPEYRTLGRWTDKQLAVIRESEQMLS
jgi:ppGpp synthetase/RelA/SpoT-type nucleotidyltranferase